MHQIKRLTKQAPISTHEFMHKVIDTHGYNIWNKEEKIITKVTIIALELGQTTLHIIRNCSSIMHDIAQQHNRDR